MPKQCHFTTLLANGSHLDFSDGRRLSGGGDGGGNTIHGVNNKSNSIKLGSGYPPYQRFTSKTHQVCLNFYIYMCVCACYPLSTQMTQKYDAKDETFKWIRTCLQMKFHQRQLFVFGRNESAKDKMNKMVCVSIFKHCDTYMLIVKCIKPKSI